MADTSKAVFSNPMSRTLAATLGVLLTCIFVISAMPTYLPFSQSDTIALPTILFPLIWLTLFLYVCFCQKIWHAWLVLLVLSSSHILLIFLQLQAV